MTRISDMTSLSALPTSGALVPIEIGDGANYKYDLTKGIGVDALFINAATLSIPTSSFFQSSGYSALDVGSVVYVHDASVNSAYVTANPRSSFVETGGRGFRLSLEQDITPEMFGATGLGVADDYPAFQAAIDFLPAAGGRITVPAGTYKLLTKPAPGTKTIFWTFAPGTTFTGAGSGAGNFPTSAVVSDLGLYYRLGGSAWPEKDQVFDDVSHGSALAPIVSNAGTADFFTPFRRSAFLAAGHKGGLQTALFDGQIRGAPDVSSTDPDYTPIQGLMSSTVNLGGTGLTTGTARGALFGSAFLAVAYTGATNLLNLTGCEYNVQVETGASVAIKTGNQIVQMPDDAVSGSLVDAGLAFSNQVGAIGWDMAICASHNFNGQHSVKSTGTLIGTLANPSCAKGLDFSGVTFSGNAIATPGFSVGPSGAVVGASVAIGGGTALTKAVVYTPSITPASVAAATVAEQTFTVTGVTTADKIIVNPPAIANSTGIAGARVSAADTVAIRFINPTAGALTPTSGIYTVLALRS